ncbi:MAG: hypothetical protein JWQ55_4619 [Rhodopila sp.]|nr:hypothetical protein [Rhodopila sp.]
MLPDGTPGVGVQPEDAAVARRIGGAASVPCAELMAVAHEYEQAKRPDDAERILGYILTPFPTHAPALHLMGIIAFHKGQKARALALMEKATRTVSTRHFIIGISAKSTG